MTVDELKQEVQRLNADLARSQVHLQQAESRIHAEKVSFFNCSIPFAQFFH